MLHISTSKKLVSINMYREDAVMTIYELKYNGVIYKGNVGKWYIPGFIPVIKYILALTKIDNDTIVELDKMAETLNKNSDT